MNHWLMFDNDSRITGCHCGYRSTAEPDAYDYGDNVVGHLQAEAWQEGWVSSAVLNPYRPGADQ